MNKLSKALAALLACALLAPAGAATPQDAARKGYYDMCLQAVNMPKPYGEWDLKGNARLPAYCECFSDAFLKRAMKAAAAMQAGQKPPSLEQSNKDELALRNTCRVKAGLPAAVEPK